MNFLIGLAAKLIEKLVMFFANMLAKFIIEKKEEQKEHDKVEENLKKVKESKTQDERRKNVENLLNGD